MAGPISRSYRLNNAEGIGDTSMQDNILFSVSNPMSAWIDPEDKEIDCFGNIINNISYKSWNNCDVNYPMPFLS